MTDRVVTIIVLAAAMVVVGWARRQADTFISSFIVAVALIALAVAILVNAIWILQALV